MMNTVENINRGEQIKAMRKNMRLSQEAIGEKCGFKYWKGDWSRMENGYQEVTKVEFDKVKELWEQWRFEKLRALSDEMKKLKETEYMF